MNERLERLLELASSWPAIIACTIVSYVSERLMGDDWTTFQLSVAAFVLALVIVKLQIDAARKDRCRDDSLHEMIRKLIRVNPEARNELIDKDSEVPT